MKTWSLQALTDICQGEIFGNPDFEINGVCSISEAKAHKITYIGSDKFLKQSDWNPQTVYIIHPKHQQQTGLNNAILHAEPTKAYRLIATLFTHQPTITGIHPDAMIADSAKIGENTSIGANTVIGEHVIIGNGCVIANNVNIADNVRIGDGCNVHTNAVIAHDVTIGNHCLIRTGAVIGEDGFGFSFEGGTWQNIPQLGSVILGNEVEVGVNSCIDRGAIENTVIGNGVKLDNLVHIAHNVNIGDHTAIAACSGVAGSTKIGKHCLIAGRVGISGHIHLCDGVQINGGATVLTSIHKPGTYAGSFYVMESQAWNRTLVYFKRLESLFRKK